MKLLTVLILAAAGLFAQAEDFAVLIARGTALDHFGDYPGAVTTFRRALALAEEKQLGDWARATTLNSLAMSYDEMGQPAEAVHLYRRSLVLIEKTRGRNSLDYATVLGNLGADLNLLGQPGAGESMLRETLKIITAHTPLDETRLAISQTILATMVLGRGARREGEDLLTQAIAVLEKSPGNARQLPTAFNNLGVIRRYQKRDAEAVALFQKTLQVLETEYGRDHPKMLQTLNNLALAQFEAGNSKEAGQTMERAIAIGEKGVHSHHATYGALLVNYAEFLRKTGRKSVAKQYEVRGRSVIEDAARRNGVGQTIDVSSFRPR